MGSETSRRLDYFRILATFFVVGIHTNSGLSGAEGIRLNISLGLDVLYRTAVPGFYGSSGSLVATENWFEVKFSAEEEDSNSVVLEGLESSGVGLDGLDAAVETFSV